MGVLAILMLYLLIIASGFITAMKIKDGFGKLLASGLVFTMAFQVFTVVGGITLVIPLTGSDPALYGGRWLQSDRQLYSRDPAHHHLEFGQCARAGADLGYVPVRGFGRAAQQGT